MTRAVHKLMRVAYPELDDSIERVAKIVLSEETRFARTLAIGLKKLDDDLGATTSIYEGSKAFKLYDTYGLPLDFITDAVRDLKLTFDDAGFQRAMQEQRTRARASWKGGHKDVANPVYAKLAERFKTEPDFYFCKAPAQKIAASKPSSRKTASSTNCPPAPKAEIVLDRTVFYSESGGQVSDVGTLWNNEHTMLLGRSARRLLSGLRPDRTPR